MSLRPVYPGAWVAHTAALREAYPPPPPSLSALPVSSASERAASDASTLPAAALEPQLSVNMDMAVVVRAMLRPDSGMFIYFNQLKLSLQVNDFNERFKLTA